MVEGDIDDTGGRPCPVDKGTFFPFRFGHGQREVGLAGVPGGQKTSGTTKRANVHRRPVRRCSRGPLHRASLSFRLFSVNVHLKLRYGCFVSSVGHGHADVPLSLSATS